MFSIPKFWSHYFQKTNAGVKYKSLKIEISVKLHTLIVLNSHRAGKNNSSPPITIRTHSLRSINKAFIHVRLLNFCPMINKNSSSVNAESIRLEMENGKPTMSIFVYTLLCSTEKQKTDLSSLTSTAYQTNIYSYTHGHSRL